MKEEYEDEITCPKCKEEISYLNYEEKKIETGSFKPKITYSWNEYEQNYEDSIEMDFFCPDCEERLGDSEEQIRELFKKKDNLYRVFKKAKKVMEEKGNEASKS